jgi:hypothetical protein
VARHELALVRLHELARRIDLEHLALDVERAAVGALALGAPAAALAQVDRERGGPIHVVGAPPLRQLLGRERAEHALGRGGDLDAREHDTLGDIGDRGRLRLLHVSSR